MRRTGDEEIEDCYGFREWGERLSNWGRWGEHDELGTLNFATPERRVAAAQQIRNGKVYNLGMALDENGPRRAGKRFSPIHRMTTTLDDEIRPGGMMVADDIMIMPLHWGTHWDGLAHVGYDGLTYNGGTQSTVTAKDGATRNSIEKVADRLLGRGVLLDIARLKGVDSLEGGEEIGPQDLSAAKERQNVSVGPGDFLLIRTGWYRNLIHGDVDTYMGGKAPGIGLPACEWLHDREIAALAADTRAVEVNPSSDEFAAYPVHMVLIRDVGMTLGESFNLEGLADDCADDGLWEFFFSGAGLQIVGGVGSPVTPLAVK